MIRSAAARAIAPSHHELCIADLDAVTGGAPISAAPQQAAAGKAGAQPNHVVVIAIIAILIG